MLVDALIWSADSKDQDFRDEKWNGTSLNAANQEDITVKVQIPESGFKAFYVDLKYKAPFKGEFTQSTRMFVMNSKNLLLKNRE